MNIKVVKKEPGKDPEIGKIENNYKALQEYVGGIFQFVSMPDGKDLNIICNDEGKLLQLDSNIYLPEFNDLVVGKILFAAHDDEGDMRDLTDSEIEKVTDYCRKNSAPYIDPQSKRYESFLRVEFFAMDNDEPDMGD